MLVVRQEQAEAYHALNTAFYLILLITLVGGGTIIFLAFYLTSKIVRRMEGIDREKAQLNEQLIRAGRLAELGEMAAGFAHEINNPLQIIRSEQTLIETILDEMKENKQITDSDDMKDISDSLLQIQIQIDRCSNITQSILKFGRKTDPATKELDLERFIPEILDIIGNQAAVQGVSIKLEIMEDTPPVKGDPAQLQQVLLNLVNNALDAIIKKHGYKGGELVVGTRAWLNGEVEIFVKDNGSGIHSADMDRIFTPFFTTKPVGKGTGLGLSVCYGIINKMDGKIEVESHENVGTTFSIRLKTNGTS
jgi:two-component system NtrC family sensor kinase